MEAKPGISDHDAVITDFSFRAKVSKKKTLKVFVYDKTDVSRLKDEIAQLRNKFLSQCWGRSVNKLASQMRAPLVACREPAGKLWQLCKVLYVFEHETQYLLIHAPFTPIVVFWHISNIPPMIL